jgi:phosphoribosylglycinamide formyltransferase-1
MLGKLVVLRAEMEKLALFNMSDVANKMAKIVVLISGSGSNLQAIIDNATHIGVQIVAVISNKAGVLGLQRAQQANIPTRVVISKDKSREEFDAELATLIDEYCPKLVILAGFMRILTPEFANKFHKKMLNIHPSLLPKFKGLNTHQRAIEAGETYAGATVHIVSSELDSGEIIDQIQVAIAPNDDPTSLAVKVLKQEHILYPRAIKKYLEMLA